MKSGYITIQNTVIFILFHPLVAEYFIPSSATVELVKKCRPDKVDPDKAGACPIPDGSGCTIIKKYI